MWAAWPLLSLAADHPGAGLSRSEREYQEILRDADLSSADQKLAAEALRALMKPASMRNSQPVVESLNELAGDEVQQQLWNYAQQYEWYSQGAPVQAVTSAAAALLALITEGQPVLVGTGDS